VANFFHPVLGHRLRASSTGSNAQNQAAIAVKSMPGQREPYTDIPWFWSDQYDLEHAVRRHATRWDVEVARQRTRAQVHRVLHRGRVRGRRWRNRQRDIRPTRADPAGVAIESATKR
jgi:3-phenylpropionate/trans-cinnamate dioxygenase ferredoxin reductase subunit